MTVADGMFDRLTPQELAAVGETPKRDKTPIIPVPADAPPMTFQHPRYGSPSKTWPYCSADGELVGYAARFDFTAADGAPAKDVLPVTFCDLGNGKRGWRSKGIPDPRPLYRLPEILQNREACLIVAEGEKSADAAALLFPDMVATTPMHGAKSPHKTDWSVVAGRTVVIATDHDQAGREFGDRVHDLLVEAGVPCILHLHPERLAAWIWQDGKKVLREGEIPQGWDIADALTEGWDVAAMADLWNDPAFLPPYLNAEARAEIEEAREAKPAAAPAEKRREWPFRLVASGVEKKVERTDKETGETTVEWKWLCSHLEVSAETRDAEGGDWGRLLVVVDRDKTDKEWAMPMAMLAGDGTAYRERLLSMGLEIAPGRFAREALHEYISTARPKHKARCVSRVGWHGDTFVLPDGAIGAGGGETVILQTTGALDHAFRLGGTLEGWQQEVARLAAGNSRLGLALSAAFAAPLLHLTGAESGGFHLRGPSSTGKSTALVVAGSAWGGGGLKGYVKQWRATDNGLEAVAASHSDTLLCLDELSQIAPAAAGAAAYMIANGAGKVRAGRSGEGRAAAEWRSLFLSSGEISIADKLAEDGKGRRAAAGQQVRVVDIPADAGARLGLFEQLHGFVSAEAFARHLKAAASQHFGHAARSFLEGLVRAPDATAQTVAQFRGEFLAEHCPKGADGQIERVAGRFALAAAAGEMATAFGVLPWQPGEATRAAAKCLAAWLEVRGGIESTEERDAIAAVRRFIELHGASRFERMWEEEDRLVSAQDERIINRAGYRRKNAEGGVEYLILPETWKAEVCAGMDATVVAQTLKAKGLLVPASDGKLQDRARLPGSTHPVRHYHLTAGILGDA
jgi:putative DNA primase/helicase